MKLDKTELTLKDYNKLLNERDELKLQNNRIRLHFEAIHKLLNQ